MQEAKNIHKYSIIPFLQHKLQIDKNLSKFEIGLIDRREKHDGDKEHDIIENSNRQLKAQAIFEHKLTSRHHPDGNPNMNLVDYIEMLCDWVSYWQAENVDKKLWTPRLIFYCERFDIPEQITTTLRITLKDFFLEGNND